LQQADVSVEESKDDFQRFSLRTSPIGLQWAILLVISALFVVILESLNLLAALLLGPMLAAILVARTDRFTSRAFFSSLRRA
jgi:uncharacterized membrane protein AbrB (regulator of aidB expression)